MSLSFNSDDSTQSENGALFQGDREAKIAAAGAFPSGDGVPAGRFAGIQRDYTEEDVLRLRGSVQIRHTLAELGAARLWELLHTED
jgi:hypothetical protein